MARVWRGVVIVLVKSKTLDPIIRYSISGSREWIP